MKLRLATYNCNNLFRRAAALQLEGFSPQAKAVLQEVAALSELLARDSYAGPVGGRILKLLVKYDQHLAKRTKHNRWFSINMVKGKLFKVPKGGQLPVLAAAGRGDWLGWVELTRETVDETSTQNTARVIQSLDADVLCVVEVEDRLTLERFSAELLKPLAPAAAYAHAMLIDGNDPRGIDVGVLSRFPVASVRPHVDDTFTGQDQKPYRVFSRDCPEYEVTLPEGRTLWLLANHFKSQGYGSQASNDAKRQRQAERVREILRRFDLKRDLVAVAGDLNGTPDSAPLQPLLRTPGLNDVLKSPIFNGPVWTHGGRQQLDYLLVSTPLFKRLKSVGIERRGIFQKPPAGQPPAHLPTVTNGTTQASDHAAVWAEFAL
ncbi:MAG: hydrolase [Limisphaerales bacterium]|nr:MAG: hydrolase [Limisphaerales bacterium]KAG0507696.1 MAG: hydrolase [Limisphaerales bacterium]TXT52432.1 MAG: hydrolase [Limisphaerales bacterium]